MVARMGDLLYLRDEERRKIPVVSKEGQSAFAKHSALLWRYLRRGEVSISL